MNNQVFKASRLAAEAHSGQTRRDGFTPYITHVERVVQRVYIKGGSDVAVAAAWLHDVQEDCGVTNDFLRNADIDENVIAVVDALTRKKNEAYVDFIDRVCRGGHDARMVKICDILDNLSDSPTWRQLQKYSAALVKLTKGSAVFG